MYPWRSFARHVQTAIAESKINEISLRDVAVDLRQSNLQADNIRDIYPRHVKNKSRKPTFKIGDSMGDSFKLRDYQREAVEAVVRKLRKGYRQTLETTHTSKRSLPQIPVVVIPPGGGKSLVIAAIAGKVCYDGDHTRTLIVLGPSWRS